MRALLWAVVVFGVLELAATIAYSSVGKVPERTARGMITNGLLMFGFAMWAFWLLCQ